MIGGFSKPAGGMIDWTHPLVSDGSLDICVIPQSGVPFDMVRWGSGGRPTSNAASTYVNSPWGIARKIVTGKDDYGNLGDYGSLGYSIPGLTLFALVTHVSGTSARICGREVVTSAFGYCLAPSTTANRFIFNPGSGFTTLTGTTYVVGQPYALCGVLGNGSQLFENGKLTASSATGWTTLSTTATSWCIGATVGTSAIYPGLISAVYQWKRPLSRDEVKILSASPFCFIKTGPKLYSPQSARNRMLMGVGV